MAEFEDTLDGLDPIERRGTLRGYLHDVSVDLGGDELLNVIEASRKGLFVGVDDPDKLPLGDRRWAVIQFRDYEVRLKVEVVRKEIEPRRGIGVRIIKITEDQRFDFEKILVNAVKKPPGAD